MHERIEATVTHNLSLKLRLCVSIHQAVHCMCEVFAVMAEGTQDRVRSIKLPLKSVLHRHEWRHIKTKIQHIVRQLHQLKKHMRLFCKEYLMNAPSQSRVYLNDVAIKAVLHLVLWISNYSSTTPKSSKSTKLYQVLEAIQNEVLVFTLSLLLRKRATQTIRTLTNVLIISVYWRRIWSIRDGVLLHGAD
jgi:hypothetical protein